MFSPDQIIDIQKRYADGYPMRNIIWLHGLDATNSTIYDAVFNICHKRRGFGHLTDPQPWQPTCMSVQEYIEWKDLTEKMSGTFERPRRPCDDCPVTWANARREEGRCNGTLPEEHLHGEEAISA